MHLKIFAKFYKYIPLYFLLSCGISTIKPNHLPDANISLAMSYADKGACKEALEIADSATLPIALDSQISLGKIYKLCKQNDKAEAYFNNIIKLTSKENNLHLDALEEKGMLLLGKAEFYSAQQAFSQIIEEDAVRWKSINGLGISLEAQNKLKEALDYYIMAKELSNNYYSVLNNIALVLGKLGHYKEALISIDEALKQTSQEEVVKKLSLNKAIILSMAGKGDLASKIAKQYLTEDEANQNQTIYIKMK